MAPLEIGSSIDPTVGPTISKPTPGTRQPQTQSVTQRSYPISKLFKSIDCNTFTAIANNQIEIETDTTMAKIIAGNHICFSISISLPPTKTL